MSVILIFLFCSCGTENNNDNQGDGQISAYDNLSELERKFFDAFVESLDDFYNPSEVKILQIDSVIELSDGTVSAIIKIQGTNRLGGTLTKWYELWNIGNGYYLKERADGRGGPTNKVSVAKLNNALSEHWEKLGF